MPTTKDICTECGRPASARANLYSCSYCSAVRHSACGSVKVTLENGSIVRACPCKPQLFELAKKEASERTATAAEKIKTLRDRNKASSEPPSRAGTPTSILEKGSQSSSLASSEAELETMNNGQSSSNVLEKLLARMDALEKKLEDKIDSKVDYMLEIVKDFSAVRETVNQHSAEIDTLKSKQDELKTFVQEIAASHSTCDAALDDGRLAEVEKTTNNLSTTVAALKQQSDAGRILQTSSRSYEPSSSQQLLVSGLSVPTGTKCRRLAYAALLPLLADLEPHDVLDARFLPQKTGSSTSGPSAVLNTPLSSLSSTEPVTSAVGNNSSKTDAVRGKNGHANSKTRPPTLLVTLASARLVRSIIIGKIKFGEFKTSNLESTLLQDAGVIDPLPPFVIHVNEFLEKDTYNLLRWVRGRAEFKAKAFKCFTRDGNIYIKNATTSEPIEISNNQDLEIF